MTIALSVLAAVLLLDVVQAVARRRPAPVSGSAALERLLPQGGRAGYPDGSESVRLRPGPVVTYRYTDGSVVAQGPGAVVTYRTPGRVDRQARVTELYADILANCELTVGQGRAIKRILEDYTDLLIPDQEGA